MYATAEIEEVHTQGRAPTAESIRRQRAEQVQAALILRGILGFSRKAVTRQQKEQALQLSSARGLPTR